VALRPSTLRRIQDTGRLSWLPGDLLVEMCEATRAFAGEDQLERWGAQALQGAVRGPLMRAFYEAALALGRHDPGVIVRQLVHVWPLLYHRCGDLVVTHTGPDSFRVVHAAVPPVLRRTANVLPLLGAVASLPGICGLRGSGSVDWSPTSSSCIFSVRWEPAAGKA
jgi:hypothetical protein